MTLLGPLRRWLAAVSGQVFGSPTDECSATGPTDEGESGEATRPSPEASLSKRELLTEAGLTPREYVLEILASEGGKARQQAIIETTGWSAGSVSRLLTEMEEDAQIVRIQVGREKIVFVPGEAPGGWAGGDTGDG